MPHEIQIFRCADDEMHACLSACCSCGMTPELLATVTANSAEDAVKAWAHVNFVHPAVTTDAVGADFIFFTVSPGSSQGDFRVFCANN